MVDTFWLLANKLLPLFLFVFTGFIAAKTLKINRDSIAKLLIYMISPIVFFETLIRSPFNPKHMLLPFFFGLICSIIGICVYHLSKNRIQGNYRNLLAYSAGSANTGYFGIPATAILLGENKLSTAIFIIIGYNLYEYSTGFYLAARGNFSQKEALAKISRLPSIWTFLASLVFSYLGWNKIPTVIEPILLSFRGAYSTLGLMMIGLGLGSLKSLRLHNSFVLLSLFIKFIIFPAFVSLIVILDAKYSGFLTYELAEILILMSLVPLAANGVTIATELKLPTDDIAFTITLSTLLALAIIPLSWSTWVPWVLSFLATGHN